jgi:hypothetical protein
MWAIKTSVFRTVGTELLDQFADIYPSTAASLLS